MGAVVVGAVQLAAPKGTLPHRIVGSIWVLLMLVVSISAFFVHELRIWGPWISLQILILKRNASRSVFLQPRFRGVLGSEDLQVIRVANLLVGVDITQTVMFSPEQRAVSFAAKRRRQRHTGLGRVTLRASRVS